MFNIDSCLAFITNQSGKIFSEELEKKLRPYDVTRSQWIAIYFIHENKSITQKELAEKMAIKEPSVVRLFQRLESEGYLLRSIDNNDKRNKPVSLSSKGEELLLKLLPVAEKFKNDTVAGIDPKDLETVQTVLAKMVDNTSEMNNSD